MKQTLQLKLGQQLTMTPQLQQAIRLLQLSTLELQTEIQEALETNPMLELIEEGDAGSTTERHEEEAAGERTDVAGEEPGRIMQEGAGGNASEDGSLDSADREVDKQAEAMPTDLPTDSDWEDTFEAYTDTYPAATRGIDTESTDYEQPDHSGESLQDHLLWQLNLSTCSQTDQAIATTIIDAIDDHGYLATPLEELHQSLAEDDPEIELDEVEAVLHRVQDFDPPGIGARNLRECMLIQLRYYDPETPWLDKARQLIKSHFEALAKRDYAAVLRRMKLSEPDMQQVMQLIQSLNPRPGGQITARQPEYVIPDVFVKKLKDQWQVELNPDTAPRIGINNLYAKLASHNNKDAAFLKNSLQEARWFLKSLKSRNETLLKVATSIVERQHGFLEYGEEAMRPMVMHDIAETVEMHESTISRVTTKKYMHTPRGIFELKYFFSSHVGTATGGECSATAIRAILKKLIAAEKPNKPLSDSKLAALLADQGINVARRTVAKYREAMSIAPSNERKRLI